MRHNTKSTFFAAILILGITAIVPSALATAQVIIIPGSGASKHCSDTTTCFTPSILHISAGDTVTWKNTDNVNHTITSGLPYAVERGGIFDSGMIAPGKTYSFTFYDPGMYKYSDKVDRWMVGEVIVEPIQSTAVPEFGTVSGLIVLVSIIGVIGITRLFMKN